LAIYQDLITSDQHLLISFSKIFGPFFLFAIFIFSENPAFRPLLAEKNHLRIFKSQILKYFRIFESCFSNPSNLAHPQKQHFSLSFDFVMLSKLALLG